MQPQRRLRSFCSPQSRNSEDGSSDEPSEAETYPSSLIATALRILAFFTLIAVLVLGSELLQQPLLPGVAQLLHGSKQLEVQATDGSTVAVSPAATPTSALAHRKPRCQVIKEMHICAHRGSTDEFDGSIAMLSRPRELGMRGIMCMDVDVFQTQDEALLVGYPPMAAAAVLAARTANGTSSLEPSTESASHSPAELLAGTTSAELTKLGLKAEFPPLLLFLRAFAANAHQLLHAGQPQLFIELKGSALSARSLIMIAQQASLLKVDQFVGVWFSNTQAGPVQDKLLAQLRSVQSNVKAVRGYLDSAPATVANAAVGVGKGDSAAAAEAAGAGSARRIPIVAEVLEGDMERFDVFGPAWRVPDALLQQLSMSDKPVALWTVNDIKVLDKAAEFAFHTVITDVPLQMKAELQTQKNACAKKGRAAGPGDKKRPPIGPSD